MPYKMKTGLRYFKYVEEPWAQPILKQNGTLGKSYFAVSADLVYDNLYSAWKAFDGNPASLYYSPDNRLGTITIYSKVPLKLKTIQITNRNGGNITATSNGEIWGSNDNKNYIKLVTFTNSKVGAGNVWDILVDSTELFNYFRIVTTGVKNHTSRNTSFAEIKLIANQLNIIPATPDDYDFTTSGFKTQIKNNKAIVFKS